MKSFSLALALLATAGVAHATMSTSDCAVSVLAMFILLAQYAESALHTENVHRQHERQGLSAGLQRRRHGLPVQQARLQVWRARLYHASVPPGQLCSGRLDGHGKLPQYVIMLDSFLR